MLIRPLAAADVAEVAAAHAAAWREGFRGLIPDDLTASWTVTDSRPAIEKALSEPEWSSFVCEREGRRVGFVAVSPDRSEPPRPGLAELRMLYVDPSAWGSGAAQALCEAALAELIARDYSEVMLLVLPGNARGRRFYEKLGFRLVDGDERIIEFRGHRLRHVVYARLLGR